MRGPHKIPVVQWIENEAPKFVDRRSFRNGVFHTVVERSDVSFVRFISPILLGIMVQEPQK